jgi:hypothetical protein
MDKLAMTLAEESSAVDAWKKIFVKPAGKSWADATVAVKTNQIDRQRTRAPVMGKVCHVLTDVVGVKGSNIHIYDACHGGDGWSGNSIGRENLFKDLPEGVHAADRWGGFNLETSLPAPYFAGERKTKCLDHLVRGEVDVLVNIALCKGHGAEFGGFTMCMKNHFGTFNPRPSHRDGGGADYLIAINKTPEILGQIDPLSGEVIHPRQQLCIIDALWASEPGPGGLPTAQPNALMMGTFAPAMDYLTATRFRRDTMGWRVSEEVLGRFLTEFGYREADLLGGGQIVDALAATA